MMVARRYLISGTVQGVGFRFFAEHAAALEGISGYVRNLPDGTVEALAEGDKDAVDRFERTLWRGPRGGHVANVRIETVAPEGRTGFTIRG
jgi:acylphosphatase